MVIFSVISIEKLYMIRLAKISCITQSFFFEWKAIRPTWYFSSLNEVSIPQRILYIIFISSAENSSSQRSRVEEVLTQHNIYYTKTESWIESEKLYEVLYEMEV